MPLKYWDQAFLATTYLINRTPSRVIDLQTPLERLFKMQADYGSLKIFGCACWPNLRPYNSHKLSFRSKQCVFLGYSNLHKGFKCLDVSSGRIYISRDVVFDESIFPFSKLNPNAGARLHSELNLLPPNLLNLPSSGSANTHDNSADILPDNAINDPSSVQENPGENGDFAQLPSYMEHETNPLTQSVRGSGGSPSDRAPSNSCSPRGEALAPPPAPQSRQHGETESESSVSPQAVAPPLQLQLQGSFESGANSEPDLPAPGSPVSGVVSEAASPPRPRTRLQAGIRKPKHFTDGTVRYGLLAANGEPNNLEEALQDEN